MRPQPQIPMRARPTLLLAPLLALALAACSSEAPEPEPTAGTPPEVLVARERAAGLFAEERTALAYEAVQPLLEREPVAVEDLVRAGILELILGASLAVDDPALVEQGEAHLRDAIERAPDDPVAYYVLAQRAYDNGYFEEALPLAERAAELAPDDAPAQLLHAALLRELAAYAEDDAAAERFAERSEAIFRAQLDRGPEFLGSWTLTALARYSRLLLDLGRIEESNALRDRRNELEARGLTTPSQTDIVRGNLGKLVFPAPEGSTADPRGDLTFGPDGAVAWPEGLVDLRAATLVERSHPIFLSDVDPDIASGQAVDGRAASAIQVDGHLDPAALVGHDGTTIWAVSRDGDAWTPAPRFALADLPAGAAPEGARIEAFTLIDLGEDRGRFEIFEGRAADGRPYRKGRRSETTGEVVAGVTRSDLELVVAIGGRLWLSAEELDAPVAIGDYAGACTALGVLDVDHDGDADLTAVGDFGLLLLRHDGAEGLLGVALGPDGEAGGFTDATEQFGLGGGRAFAWVVPEDYDTDGDVDLLLGGPDGAVWLSSDRNERWSDRSGDLPAGLSADREPLVADLDGNGFPDLWEPATGRLWVDRRGDGFRSAEERTPAVPEGARPTLVDVDLDGAVDVVWVADGALAGVLAPGLAAATPLGPVELGAGGAPFVLADVDADGRLELAAAGAPTLLELAGPDAVRIAIKGVKDNVRGVGGIVEVRSGPIYRRIHWRGEPVLVGVGGRDDADVVRVTWPNGVIQSELDAPAGGRRLLLQIEGLVGSCPFLYTWNGETFEFVSDVIGITPLGLPMAPGMLVPPDHDEYVLVTAEQLVPREDGSLVLQFTEELREVTYLDRVELIAVDHPEGTEVFPTERFCFPPFPEPHTHLVEGTSQVGRALGPDGRDWAPALAATDGELAEPFTAHRGQWLGLATPHTLELHFDPAAVRSAERLRLLMTGWLYWTDASVNVAAARHPAYEFVPPILQVPDGEGGWRDAGPPVGFPAGKTKTMVLDVTGLIDPADPRLRVFSTLRLFWDSIRLATDGDDAPRRETRLEPSAAELYDRGFSRPLFLNGDDRLEWFEWDRLEDVPRWNQHPGFYTRYGSVLPLLGAIDDRFVIMGSGDALELTFDGSDLPELPDGWRRDWLVFLDGWAKDRDPNTYEAEYVEPLPFHGMSQYPPLAGERHPDTPENRAWRREWNTRPAKRWIEPLANRRDG